jgi:hypothetical protein
MLVPLYRNVRAHTAVNHEFDDIGVTSCSQRDRMRPEEDAPTLQKALDAGAPLLTEQPSGKDRSILFGPHPISLAKKHGQRQQPVPAGLGTPGP